MLLSASSGDLSIFTKNIKATPLCKFFASYLKWEHCLGLQLLLFSGELKLQNRMSKFLKWLDDHILEYFSLALLIFIPLYPKIPIAEVLPGYLVRLRLDDILIALAFVIWVAWVVRGRVSLRKNPLLVPIGIYIL